MSEHKRFLYRGTTEFLKLLTSPNLHFKNENEECSRNQCDCIKNKISVLLQYAGPKILLYRKELQTPFNVLCEFYVSNSIVPVNKQLVQYVISLDPDVLIFTYFTSRGEMFLNPLCRFIMVIKDDLFDIILSEMFIRAISHLVSFNIWNGLFSEVCKWVQSTANDNDVEYKQCMLGRFKVIMEKIMACYPYMELDTPPNFPLELVDILLKYRKKRKIAVISSMHSRLGDKSSLKVLPTHLVRQVCLWEF